MTTPTEWPEGVIARYLTLGGATVDVSERPGYSGCDIPTETHAACGGCDEWHRIEWNFDILTHDHGNPQRASFDEGGRRSTPKVRAWAQQHAEKCRAMRRPEVTP